MSSLIGPGVRESIVIGGGVYGIESIDVAPSRAETSYRTKNGVLHVDRPYQGAGYWEVTEKRDISLTTTPLQGAAIEALELLAALPGFVDFVLWRFTGYATSGDGVTTVFHLPHRPALNFLAGGLIPAGASTTYAHKWLIGGSTASFTVGGADANGITALTHSGAPAAGSSNIQGLYVPLVYVRIKSCKPIYVQPQQEKRQIVLEPM